MLDLRRLVLKLFHQNMRFGPWLFVGLLIGHMTCDEDFDSGV